MQSSEVSPKIPEGADGNSSGSSAEGRKDDQRPKSKDERLSQWVQYCKAVRVWERWRGEALEAREEQNTQEPGSSRRRNKTSAFRYIHTYIHNIIHTNISFSELFDRFFPSHWPFTFSLFAFCFLLFVFCFLLFAFCFLASLLSCFLSFPGVSAPLALAFFAFLLFSIGLSLFVFMLSCFPACQFPIGPCVFAFLLFSLQLSFAFCFHAFPRVSSPLALAFATRYRKKSMPAQKGRIGGVGGGGVWSVDYCDLIVYRLHGHIYVYIVSMGSTLRAQHKFFKTGFQVFDQIGDDGLPSKWFTKHHRHATIWASIFLFQWRICLTSIGNKLQHIPFSLPTCAPLNEVNLIR